MIFPSASENRVLGRGEVPQGVREAEHAVEGAAAEKVQVAARRERTRGPRAK